MPREVTNSFYLTFREGTAGGVLATFLSLEAFSPTKAFFGGGEDQSSSSAFTKGEAPGMGASRCYASILQGDEFPANQIRSGEVEASGKRPFSRTSCTLRRGVQGAGLL